MILFEMVYKEFNNIKISLLESILDICFSNLKGSDHDNFSENQLQNLREWFGIDEIIKYKEYIHIIVAKDKDKIAGVAIVGVQNPLSWPDGRKYELFALGVLPEYRNKGIGKSLVLHSEKIAKQNKAKSLIIHTHILMTDTQKFYKNLSYQKLGILKDYYDNGDAIFYKKLL